MVEFLDSENQLVLLIQLIEAEILVTRFVKYVYMFTMLSTLFWTAGRQEHGLIQQEVQIKRPSSK